MGELPIGLVEKSVASMSQATFNEAFDEDVPNFMVQKLKIQDDDAASSTSASSAANDGGSDTRTKGSDDETDALAQEALNGLCRFCMMMSCVCITAPKFPGILPQQGESHAPKMKKWQLSAAAVLQDLQQRQMIEDPWQLGDLVLDDDVPLGPPPGLPAPLGLPGPLHIEVTNHFLVPPCHLHTQALMQVSSVPSGLLVPPGLSPPPTTQIPQGFTPPPGLNPPPNLQGMWNDCATSKAYTVQSFRREVTRILREVKVHKNIGLAVRQVRVLNVPKHRHADEFADILTLAVEESRGPCRRVCIAFVVGLLNVFDSEQCLNGLRVFYKQIYPDLCSEVNNLKSIMQSELMPTLKTVLEPVEVEAISSLFVTYVGQVV